MPFNNQFPYTDLHEINLNKFLKAIKNLLGGHGGEYLKKKSNIPFDYEWSTIEVSAGVDSVNGQTGTIVLTASDVGALPESYTAPVQSVNGKTGSVVLSASDVGALPDSYTPPAAPVQSVNGKTGSVVLSASDVGALPDSYTPPAAPVQSVNGKTGSVVLSASDVGALPDSYTAPVQSVNGKTGSVVLSASDVGALPDSYTPPAAPVQSVNGKTGSVILSASDVGALPDSYTPPVQSVNGNTGSVVLGASDVGALSSTPVFIQASGASGAFTDVSGGFYQFGNIVVVQILATTTRSISAGDYFTLATNAPAPAIEGVSLVANTGQVSSAPVVMAHARRTGYIYIKAATTAIGTNQYIFCTGVYIKE